MLLICAAGCGGGNNGQTQPTGTPALVFGFVPPYGSFKDLKGRAINVKPADYNVAFFIYVGGWWTKPYWDEDKRVTPISESGAWTCDITTGGVDEQATRIAAYLVPKGYIPPIAAGETTVPQDVVNHAVASLEVVRDGSGSTRVVRFSGYEWIVKRSTLPVGPPAAGNYFCDSPENVWVDQQGRLHLRITYRNGKWCCSEVICTRSFGYGTYKFTLESDVASLNENVVLGLFTWDDSPEQAHREIDIEFSRWGQADDPNAQYVVQPWDQPGRRYRFTCPRMTGRSVCSFVWSSDKIVFSTILNGNQVAPWTYDGPGIPTPGNEHPRLNLWLVGGSAVPPSDRKEVEVVVSAFEFAP